MYQVHRVSHFTDTENEDQPVQWVMRLEMPSPIPSGWAPAPWALLPRTVQPSSSLRSIKHPSTKESAFPNPSYLCPHFPPSLSWVKTKPTAELPVFSASNKKTPLDLPPPSSYRFISVPLDRSPKSYFWVLSPPLPFPTHNPL